MRAALDTAIREAELTVELVDACPNLPSVAIDTDRLSIVLTHLLSNAAQAIEAGGAGLHRITITAEARANAVELSVKDTGPGIPMDVQDHIFEPFFTVSTRPMSSGLSLAVCYGLVVGAGGSLRADSSLEGGATFTLRLPLASLELGPKSSAPERARILAVDDDPVIRRVLARALREYDVVTGDGVQAMRYLQAGERYDLILCDVEMPMVSGIDIYRSLRELDAEQARRVVFVTAGPSNGRDAELLNLTSRRVIRKPFSMSQLMALVREELGAESRGAR